MLCEKNDAHTYIIEFKKRFSNFAEKAPLLLSYTTSPKNVTVVDEATNLVYEFDWDYTIPVKSFIHGIKTVLVENCYPVLEKREVTLAPINSSRQVEMAADGVPLEEIPTAEEKTTVRKYLIDKVVVFKDVFIIKELDTSKMFRYKMNKSSVFFLKKMRSGKLNMQQAADYFFEHSELLNEIIPRPE